MLTALADEVINMDKNRRKELVDATSAQWLDIARLAQGFIPEQMAAGARTGEVSLLGGVRQAGRQGGARW